MWKERAIVSALGVFVALLAWLGGNSAIFPPELWDKVCVASGIRPPPSAIPGLWTCLASGLFGAFGISKGILILRFLGPVALGLLAVQAYRLFTETVPATLDSRMTRKGWSRRIVRFVLMQGACFFIFSDPVWRAGRIFSPTMLQLLLAVVLLRLFFWALATSSRVYAIAMAAVAGAVAAAVVIFLPQVLDGTLMNAFSFIFGRTSEYDLLLTLRTYPFIALTLVMMPVLAIFAWRMDDERLKSDFLVLVLAMLSICTVFSPGPQYWIVYIPLLAYYIACRDRNCALLACLIMMASITTVTAFFNNSFSVLTTASEYLHLCDPQTVISWMHALEGPVFGIPLTQLVVLLLEFVQLVIMILIALFLLSDLRMFDRYNRLNDFLNTIRVRLGGEIHG